MNSTGFCKLCGQSAELQDSHVWPRFGYKRYVSDPKKGGQFFDVHQQTMHNKQRRYFWFCKTCEHVIGRGEHSAAEFCNALDKAPTAAHLYDRLLLQFAVSLSFRTLLMSLEEGISAPNEVLTAARRRWRDFLLGKTHSLGPHTQHAIIVFDASGGHQHKAIGGQVVEPLNLVCTQFGPLFFAGLLGRGGLTAQDRAAWAVSQLLPQGGSITPISAWRVGVNIAMEYMSYLVGIVEHIKNQCAILAD